MMATKTEDSYDYIWYIEKIETYGEIYQLINEISCIQPTLSWNTHNKEFIYIDCHTQKDTHTYALDVYIYKCIYITIIRINIIIISMCVRYTYLKHNSH